MDKEIEPFAQLIDEFLKAETVSFEKLKTRLDSIAVAGRIVNKYTLAIRANRKLSERNSLELKLEEIGNKLEELAEKMALHFNELLLMDYHLYADIVQTASILMKFMQDTISNPCRQSLGIFRDAVMSNPPLRYGYKVISLLEHDSTNPLMRAMASSPQNSTAKFKKWTNIINGVLSQFLFLEAFLIGMFWDQDMYGPNKLESRIEKLNQKMDKLNGAFIDRITHFFNGLFVGTLN
uniref:Uncharacterized protein n=1 Tax=Caenorhabditis japonica TaxID=281687 RepID=A0A8R1HTH0_CAEJA